MPVGWKCNYIVLKENPDGPNRIAFSSDREPVICVDETDTSVIITREGENGFTREYITSNVVVIGWDKPNQ